MGGRSRPAGQPESQHAPTPAAPSRDGSATPSSGANRSSSTARRPDEPTAGRAAGSRRRHHLRGRGHGLAAARRCGHRRGGVQHRPGRLPGGHHRPLLRRADHLLHLPPHRQLRRHPRRRREPPPVLPGRDRAGPGPPAEQLAVGRGPGGLPGPPAGSGPHRRRHPPADPPHPRRRVRCPAAFGTADEADPQAAALAEPGTDGVDLVAEVTTRRALPSATDPYGWSPTTSASSATSCATSDAWPPSRWSRRRPRPTSPSAAGPTGCSSPTARATRRRSPVRRRPSPACSARSRSSASASATSCWPPPSAASTYKLKFGHHGGNHPVRRLASAGRGDHQPEPQLRGRGRDQSPAPMSPTSTSTTAWSRGCSAATCPPSACSTTPRPDPARTTPATCSPSSAASWWVGR